MKEPDVRGDRRIGLTTQPAQSGAGHASASSWRLLLARQRRGVLGGEHIFLGFRILGIR